MSIQTLPVAALVLLITRRRARLLLRRPGTRPAGARFKSPPAIGGGPVALDVTVDSVGTQADAGSMSSVEQLGRVFPLFSLGAPGAARFSQETPDRIRVTQESPSSGLAGLRDGPARLVVTASRSVLFGIRRADTVDDARAAGAPHAADARRGLQASLREPRRRRDGRVPRHARRRDVWRAGRAIASSRASPPPGPPPGPPARRQSIPTSASRSSACCTTRTSPRPSGLSARDPAGQHRRRRVRPPGASPRSSPGAA